MVAKPKVQELPNWQFDDDLKESLELSDAEPTKKPLVRSYIKHLIQELDDIAEARAVSMKICLLLFTFVKI